MLGYYYSQLVDVIGSVLIDYDVACLRTDAPAKAIQSASLRRIHAGTTHFRTYHALQSGKYVFVQGATDPISEWSNDKIGTNY
jgi:hypothetical protein